MKKIGIVLLFASLIGSAESAAPELSPTETMAIRVLQQEYTEAQKAQKQFEKDLSDFQTDFAKNHPGWKFDPSTGKPAKE